ncbi:MAG: site-2 protease family protein [Alphaproteobacteria bacterium]|nr:site-2 protease family protein [Alphaproteobacteria bacterium]
MDWYDLAFKASIWVLPALFAITLHEAAHGWAALKLGDDTAYRLGRVTFNPLRHIDPFGTVLLPAILIFSGSGLLFGWAKPVPVNFNRLHRPKRDMVWVAAAGPAMNIALALISALALHATGQLPASVVKWAQQNLVNSLQLNVVLAVFNMLPLPPLDGGRVAVGLLPNGLARALASVERYGMMILIFGLFVLPELGRSLRIDLNIFNWLLAGPVEFLIDTILGLSGLR